MERPPAQAWWQFSLHQWNSIFLKYCKNKTRILQLTCISSFELRNHPVRKVVKILLFLFYRWENRESQNWGAHPLNIPSIEAHVKCHFLHKAVLIIGVGLTLDLPKYFALHLFNAFIKYYYYLCVYLLSLSVCKFHEFRDYICFPLPQTPNPGLCSESGLNKSWIIEMNWGKH